MEIKMEFIDRLQEVMKEKNITAYKLCKDLGYGTSTFTAWKQNKTPSIEKLTEIVHYLEVSADYLLGIDKENNISINKDEEKIVLAYRKADPGIQTAIKKILDVEIAVEIEQEKSSPSRTG